MSASIRCFILLFSSSFHEISHKELVFVLSVYYNCFSSNFATGNRVTGWLTSILHRMEVKLMKNNFDFKDLMSFGMFLLALLTFIYLICH